MNKKVPMTSVSSQTSQAPHSTIWLIKAKKENCFPDKGLPATSHQFGEV